MERNTDQDTEGPEVRPSWIQRLKALVGHRRMSSMALMSTRGGIPVRQVDLAPQGLDFEEDVSPARWVQDSLSDFGLVRSILPEGLAAYVRVFHPACLAFEGWKPVRWSTVASWTGRTVHSQMQFVRIANLSESPDDIYKDPLWGLLPQHGSIPEAECRTLVDILRKFTSTPDRCYFCLWEGYGNIDTRLYKAGSRVSAPGRDYLLFSGPIDSVMSFMVSEGQFWGNSPNIWWPEDRAWCVATDIDMFDSYIGGSDECSEAILAAPSLEALPTTLDARMYLEGDTINAPGAPSDDQL